MNINKKYRVNPTCPFCHEEHEYWDITLKDEEQKTLDAYYESTKERRSHNSELANLLDDIEEKPLIVSRTFCCGLCHKEFEAYVTVLKEDEVTQ